jgi:hypothetical protein
MNLEKIDTSYWLTKNKDWMEQRKAQWPDIERVVGLNRKKTEVNVIKQYFLKGKMPNWGKYKEWDDLFRPLDLNLFLWLHPSEDIEVLNPLFQAYVKSELIHPHDVLKGYGSFLAHEFMRATSPYKSLEEYPFPYMGRKNIIVFRILFGDINNARNIINIHSNEISDLEESKDYIFNFLNYSHFLRMWHWLLQDAKSPLSMNCLYQYEDVLEWMTTTMVDGSEFIESLKHKVNLNNYYKALYCIHHFDTEKEGDTCRTRFVHKIRKILDERDFIPEFKQMWEDVKAGKVEVKDPWKR